MWQRFERRKKLGHRAPGSPDLIAKRRFMRGPFGRTLMGPREMRILARPRGAEPNDRQHQEHAQEEPDGVG